MAPDARFIGVERPVAVPGVKLLEVRVPGNPDGGPLVELVGRIAFEVGVVQSYFRPKFESRSESRQERAGGR
jgi:hypothetical protein